MQERELAVSIFRVLSVLVLAGLGLGSLVVSGCVGCDEAPPPPDGAPPAELSLYQAFHADQELLDPLLQEFIDEGVAYWEEGGDDCYRIADLSRCDVESVCMSDLDPTDVPSVSHADLLEYPVTLVEEAMMVSDWMTVFTSSYNEFETVWEEGREAYLDGDSHFYSRTYQATLPIITAEIAIVTNLQYRRIDDWDGTGEPLVLIRTYYPEEPLPSSENITSTMMFSLEALVPWDDGDTTMRVFATWSDLRIGGYGTDDSWGLACSQSKSSWSDLDEWCEENE